MFFVNGNNMPYNGKTLNSINLQFVTESAVEAIQ